MADIPITTATGLGPLPDVIAARESAKAVRRVFAGEGVPLALIEHRQHKIPLATLARLFERAAHEVGDWRLGLDVGLGHPPREYGLWARYAMQAPTLGRAISRVARTLHVHQTGSVMRIAPRSDGRVAWEYWHPGIELPDFRQHTDHLAPVMIRFARAYLGPDWRPLGVEVGYPRPNEASQLEAATDTSWIFERHCQAILMPASALQAAIPQGREPLPENRLIGYADVVAETSFEATHTQVADIATVIALRLLEGSSDIAGAASMLGTGRRTLQRRLEEQGLSYRSLVMQIRMRRAKSLIQETEASLKQIGMELGYADPAHFTRAFTSYYGFPPSWLRRTPAAD